MATSAQVILGIDAAWTPDNPSGLALVGRREGRCEVLCVARSYTEFADLARAGSASPAEWLAPAANRPCSIPELLDAAKATSGREVGVVSLDIPLAPLTIKGRRCSDNKVSSEYGSRGASTHSPTACRPGQFAAELFSELRRAGFRWVGAANTPPEPGDPCFIETYPHPAIIELLGLSYRLPYKVGRHNRYWREESPETSWGNLARSLDDLRCGIARVLDGAAYLIPSASDIMHSGNCKSRTATLKGIEDVLDAAVCAWVGCEYLAGRAIPYGDETSAIWLPTPRSPSGSNRAQR
jgi:predicted RNase H-like nuclease